MSVMAPIPEKRAYRRGDPLAKRHRLAADWTKFCLSPPNMTAAENNMLMQGRGTP
jgi:hypothetical protein